MQNVGSVLLPQVVDDAACIVQGVVVLDHMLQLSCRRNAVLLANFFVQPIPSDEELTDRL